MRILVTGNYKQSYNRIRIMLSGLEKLGIDLVEHRYEKRDSATARRIAEMSKDFDLVFLPSFTHPDVPFIKKIVSIPVVFDPLVSRYLTKVFDRKKVWRFSPRAYKNFLKDKRAFNNSDIIIADTESHKQYYTDTFRTDPGKIIVVPVGVDTGLFHPLENKADSNEVTVGFYGTFIPLHGIDRIILAAHELKDHTNIRFEIYGKGPLLEKISKMCKKQGSNNIFFKGWVEYHELNRVINNMDICLGIFGDSLKTDLVIPNKIYHYSACAKPIITKDTQGIREIFNNGENILLSSNDPKDIASAVLKLANDPEMRKKTGMNAHELVSREYNEMKIAERLIHAFEKSLSSTKKCH